MIATRRIIAITVVQVAVGEIGGVDQPGGAAVLADELAGDVNEVGLLAKIAACNSPVSTGR